jgi:hypothetical protein
MNLAPMPQRLPTRPDELPDSLTRREHSRAGGAGALLSGLLFFFGLSVMSDAQEMVRAGGELTLCFRLSARWA